MWSDPLPSWYAAHGRHHLPWRQTRDPWAVLLSEVMLQQTSVGRVLERWGPLLERWPDPAALAATPLDELLRAWDGLGYPRRARGLHLAATRLATDGWPSDEAGLRELPGVGTYTARALLALSLDVDAPPPRDVNLGRVAARAGLGVEAHQAAPARLDDELRRSRPATMSARDHTLALFDLGATVCRARAPRCDGCPVAPGCASRERMAAGPPAPPPRRQPAWAGSHRQLRGAVLRALLAAEPPASAEALAARVAHPAAARRPGELAAVVTELHREGLVAELPRWAASLACAERRRMATRSDWLNEAERELWARQSFSFIPDRRFGEPNGDGPEHGGGPRVVFAGFPSDYSLAFLLALLQLDVELVGIVTSPGAHPAILGTNALSQIADHLSIPLLRNWRVNDEHSRQDITHLQPALGVIASFDQILGARTLAIPVHGWLNIHPSALPAYRGPEPIYWTIADGASEAGITLHRAVPKFDAGPIVAQRRLRPAADETAGTLTRRLSRLGTEALGEAVAAMLGDEPGVDPDLAAGSYRPSVGHRHLGAATSAAQAERMVRAGVPNMPAWIEVEGHPIYVTEARVVPDCGAAAGLRYADGCLQLLETAVACGCHHDDPTCPHRERLD